MRFTTKRYGFSIMELSIVMFLTTLITGVLVLFYSQSRLTLERGVQKTELQQKVRLSAARVIPKIASAFYLPPDPDFEDPTDPAFEEIMQTTGLLPIEEPPIYNETTEGMPAQAHAGWPKLRVNSTREWVKSQLRLPVLPEDLFDPHEPRYAQLELDFRIRATQPPGHDVDRLGPLGDLFMIGHLDNDEDGSFETVTDPLMVVQGVQNISFLQYADNRRVRLRVEVAGFVRSATSNANSEKIVDRLVHETDIFLPVFTTTPE
ncbi:MAG: hypothetical protein WC314_14435 [Vulcanimicrobiota bacterium]